MFYMRIAKCGYEYEQYHAFFPLLPAAIAAVRSLGALLRISPHTHLLPHLSALEDTASSLVHTVPYTRRVLRSVLSTGAAPVA